MKLDSVRCLEWMLVDEGERQCSGTIVVHDWRVVGDGDEAVPFAQASCDVEGHHFLLPVAKLGEEAIMAFKAELAAGTVGS